MKKLISVYLLIFTLLLFNVAPAFAANHNGDAVYRDGAVYGLTWHAAINDWSTVGYYVIHAPGGSGVVQFANWATFLNSHTYQGPPQYKSGMTDNDLNNVLNTAAYLASRYNVTYTAIDLMHYNQTSNTWILPSEVAQLRCDGLVEYCYEWYNWPVLTDRNGNWDISYRYSTLYHSSAFLTNYGYAFNPVTQWTFMNPHYD